MNPAVSPLETFRAKGIPHRRLEDWKYSDLRSVLDEETVAGSKGVLWRIDKMPPGVESRDIRTDGLPNWVKELPKHRSDASSMDAAAWAFASEGVALRIPHGTKIVEPIRLELRSHGHGQIILLVGKGASATLFETHCDGDEGLRNLSVSIVLEEDARLTHFREAVFSGKLIAVETVSVIQKESAKYRAYLIGGGARLSRTELNVTLEGDGAEADISGISVLGGDAHADITTRIDHAAPNTTSRQLFKKVAGGHSRAVYQGKITVRKGAVGSDSRQTAKALLLSPRAEADLKPELEILADDVKCAHGAAVGDLDADSLFYLRSRGIPEGEARALLVQAFLQDVADQIVDENIRAATTKFVENGLLAAMGDMP